jgi:hypothetical protein
MIWTFKLSFDVVDILGIVECFGYFLKNWAFYLIFWSR